jgi:hypothetical protein
MLPSLLHLLLVDLMIGQHSILPPLLQQHRQQQQLPRQSHQQQLQQLQYQFWLSQAMALTAMPGLRLVMMLLLQLLLWPREEHQQRQQQQGQRTQHQTQQGY